MTRLMALTVQQPWAWAIAAGHKPVENRTWRRGYRGPLAIHAGRQWDRPGTEVCREIVEELGIVSPGVQVGDRDLLATGVVLAVASSVDYCALSTGSRSVVCECGPWAMPGQIHWRLSGVRRLARPVPVRGAQQLWPVEIPDELMEAT